MSRLTAIPKPLRWLLITVSLAGVLWFGAYSGNFDVLAALPDPDSTLIPTVVSVNTNTTANSFTVNFYTDLPALVRIKYGTTTAYGSYWPANQSWIDSGGDNEYHTVTVTGLTSATTYHYAIETVRLDNTGYEVTGDRTAITASDLGAATLTINEIRVDCTGGNCLVFYSTSAAANVQLRYDLDRRENFNDYILGAVSEPDGFISAMLRSLPINNLDFNTVYHYRLQATSLDGTVTTTGDMTFETGDSADDRTFSTGSCSVDGVSYPIGSCLPDHGLCDDGAVVVYDCAADIDCGYRCPAGETCLAGGICALDPAADSVYQCNKSDCYAFDGSFISPAIAGCYSSWPRCTANTVLKVRKDRGCNLWLSCSTSLQTRPTNNQPSENLCLSLSACNSLSTAGQCENYLPRGQCSNNPLRFCNDSADCLAGGVCSTDCIAAGTCDAGDPSPYLRDVEYSTPDEISELADLSGNVVAGLNWDEQAGLPYLTGLLPWQMMRQIGGASKITDGDMEYDPPRTDNWVAVPIGAAEPAVIKNVFENQNIGPNHVLSVSAFATAANVCSDDPTLACTAESLPDGCGVCGAAIEFSGVATAPFATTPTEYYYAEARIRADSPITVRVQFGYDNYAQFYSTDVDLTSAWQRVTLGPVNGMSGDTRFAVVLAPGQENATFEVDDVQIRPILQVDASPTYVTPSCRLYPKEDAPSCDYVDAEGVTYAGWRGYCLEYDSLTGTCLSWWPVDLIKGESDIFGNEQAAGYADRTPLFMCVEAKGNNSGNDFNADLDYVIAERHINGYTDQYGETDQSSCNPIGDLCINDGGAFFLDPDGYTIAQCNYDTDVYCENEANDQTGNIYEDEIVSAEIINSAGAPNVISHVVFPNNAEFKNSTQTDPYWDNDDIDNENRICQLIYYRTDDNYNYWQMDASYCKGVDHDLNASAAWFYLKFDKQTGKLLSYGLKYRDTYDDDWLGVGYQVHLTVKETCTKIVKVVDLNGDNVAFASRINDNSYIIDDIGYRLTTDLTPFGGTVPPQTDINDPATWPLMTVEAQDIVNYDSPGQSRAGSPYACVTDCGPMTCTATGTTCMNNGELDNALVQQCQEHTDANGLPDPGQCTGTLNHAVLSNRGEQTISDTINVCDDDPTLVCEHFAQNRLQTLFVKSYGTWNWNFATGQYEYQDVGWDPPTEPCLDADGNLTTDRPADFPDDYCGIPPTMFCPDAGICAADQHAQFLNSVDDLLTVDRSGSVTIKFNTTADADQVPLNQIAINWGDSTQIDAYSFPYAPRSDPAYPHIFSHAYVWNPNSGSCFREDGDLLLTCDYPIRIQVEDNWGWCNGDSEGTRCATDPSQWQDTGLTVRVRP